MNHTNTEQWLRQVVLIVILAWLACAVSCQGGHSGAIDAGTITAADVLATAELSADSLPALPAVADGILSPQRITRDGSAIIALETAGEDYFAASNGLPISPPALVMISAEDDYSWALYHFQRQYSDDLLDKATIEVSPDSRDFFVGLSDYDSLSWRLIPATAAAGVSEIEILANEASFDSEGNFFVAIIAWNAQDFLLNKVSLQLNSQQLPAPQNVQASDGTVEDGIEISWDPVEGAEYYQIHRLDLDGPYWWEVKGDSWTDHNPDEKTVYEYSVIAQRKDWMTGQPSAADSGYVGAPPTAALDVNVYLDGGELCADFDAGASSDNDYSETIVQYRWDWTSDGTIDWITESPQITFVYPVSKSYIATVTVLDDEGMTASASRLIHLDGWTHTWGFLGADTAECVAVDSQNNIYVTGNTTVTGMGSFILTLKYSPAGDLLWQKTWGDAYADQKMGSAIAVSSEGDVFVAGYARNLGNHNGSDIPLLKYDADGNLLKQVVWEGPAEDYCFDLAIDGDDNVYVVGNSMSYGNGEYNICLLKFDPDCTLTQTRFWSRGNSESYNMAAAAAIDDNVLYIAGSSREFGSSDKPEALLMQIGLTGDLNWAKLWGGDESEDFSDIAIIENGDILCTGFSSSFQPYDNATPLVKFNSTGQLLWQKGISGIFNTRKHQLTLNDDGSFTVFGDCWSYGSWRLFALGCDALGELQLGLVFGTDDANAFLNGAVRDGNGYAYIAGITPQAAGEWLIWDEVDPAFGLSGNAVDNPGAMLTDLLGDVITVTGDETVIPGIEDTGGGGYDALVKQVRRPMF